MLVESEDEGEGSNKDDSTADAEGSGERTGNQPNRHEDEEVDHGHNLSAATAERALNAPTRMCWGTRVT